MDFDLSEEQQLLKDSLQRLLADHCSFEQRTAYAKEPDGWSRSLWARYAELGVLGLSFEERHGGLGAGTVETMVVMEALGRSLALEPYLATVVLAGGCLRHAGGDAQKTTLVPKIADGSLILALAHGERQSRYDLADVQTTARRDGDGWILDGERASSCTAIPPTGSSSAHASPATGATARASVFSWSTRMPPASPGAAIPRSTASAPPRSRSPPSVSVPMPFSASRARRCP